MSRSARRTESEERVTQFVSSEFERLVRGVALTGCGVAAAEDAVAEATARVWERLDRGDVIHSLDGWVAVTAFNLVKSRFRRARVERRLRPRLVSTASSPDLGDAVASLDVVDAMSELPLRQQQAIVLRYFLDLDLDTIAGVQGVATGTVKPSLRGTPSLTTSSK